MIVIHKSVALSTTVMTCSKVCEGSDLHVLKWHTDLISSVVYYYIFCQTSEVQPASERKSWKGDGGKTPLFVILWEIWMQEFHRIGSRSKRKHLRISKIGVRYTDFSYSLMLQIHRHFVQLRVVNTQILHTAESCKDTNISGSLILQIQRLLLWLTFANPEIFKTAESCISTILHTS
jgi:hypothetical protein